VINDISTQSTKLNDLAISFGRPWPKKAPASGSSPPDQGLCPWTLLGALPDPRYMLALRARHVTPKPNSCIHQCNPLHCEILCPPMVGALSYHRPARTRAGELAGNCARQRSWPVRTFSKCTVFPILHIKGQNFPDVFYPFTSTYDPYER